MKIKLTKEELGTLIQVMKCPIDHVSFNTKLESKLSGFILRELLTSLMKRSMDLKDHISFSIDQKTLLVLNHILPQIYPTEPYQQAVMSLLIEKINKECLSI